MAHRMLTARQHSHPYRRPVASPHRPTGVGHFPEGLFAAPVKTIRDASLARKAPIGSALAELRKKLKAERFQPPVDAVGYFGFRHPFSHLHPTGIRFNGQDWSTVEQAYQSALAALAGDHAALAALARATRGQEHKAISKTIDTGNCQRIWAAVSHVVMFALDYAKYQQNPQARETLLATGDRYLYENSPTDLFWGPPCNVAGEILMEVRRCLRNPTALPSTLWIGDSLLQGLAENLDKSHRVASIPGATTNHVTRLAPWMLYDGVQRVILCVGTNDLFRRGAKPARVLHRPSKVVTRLCNLVGRVRQAIPSATVFVVELPARFCDDVDDLRRAPDGVRGVNVGLWNARTAGKLKADILRTPILTPQDLAADGLHLRPATIRRLALHWGSSLGPLIS